MTWERDPSALASDDAGLDGMSERDWAGAVAVFLLSTETSVSDWFTCASLRERAKRSSLTHRRQ